MFETIKSIFRPQVETAIITINSPVNYAELPQGFFRVETASGRRTLGYNCSTFLCWDCGTTVVVGRDRVTLGTSPDELPLVKLNLRSQTNGVHDVNGRGVIDTDLFDENDGSVSWDGATPNSDWV